MSPLVFDNVGYWRKHNTYPPDEIAVRFKHRIVSIHCFANGNGRHSRLMTDIIIEKIYKLPVFHLGAANRSNEGYDRTAHPWAAKQPTKTVTACS